MRDAAIAMVGLAAAAAGCKGGGTRHRSSPLLPPLLFRPHDQIVSTHGCLLRDLFVEPPLLFFFIRFSNPTNDVQLKTMPNRRGE